MSRNGKGDAFTKLLRRRILSMSQQLAVVERHLKTNPRHATLHDADVKFLKFRINDTLDILKLYEETMGLKG